MHTRQIKENTMPTDKEIYWDKIKELANKHNKQNACLPCEYKRLCTQYKFCWYAMKIVNMIEGE